MSDLIVLDWDQFAEQFKPIPNHLNEDAAYDGTMFETYGAEYGYVRFYGKAHELCVWTVVTGDDGQMLITEGHHWVNRMGYILTLLPYDPTKQYNVDEDEITSVDLYIENVDPVLLHEQYQMLIKIQTRLNGPNSTEFPLEVEALEGIINLLEAVFDTHSEYFPMKKES